MVLDERTVGKTRLTVTVETPRWGFVKRDGAGRVDYVSPLPCPFNYGCVPDRIGGDGDPQDVVLLGPRRSAGTTLLTQHQATVRFIDAGECDDKWVCSETPIQPVQRAQIVLFFRVYGRFKSLLNRMRGRTGQTAYLGWQRQ